MNDLVDIPESDADLLAQCDLESFRAGGPGGQHVNTTDSAVRLRHRPTGITVLARDERSQHRNKALCLERLRERLAALNRRKPKRIPTRKPKSAKRRTLDAKTRRGRIKSLRGPPGAED